MSNSVLPILLSIVERALPLVERFVEAKLADALRAPPAVPVVPVAVLEVNRIAKAVANANAQLNAIATTLGALKSSVQGVPADTGAIQGQMDQIKAAVEEVARTVASISVAPGAGG